MYTLSICIDSNLLHIINFSSIVSDFIYTYIYSILIISSLTFIIVYSGPSKELGKKLVTYIGTGAGLTTIYTGGKEIYKDVKSVRESLNNSDDNSSKPSGSNTSPSGSNTSPSGSNTSSNQPSSSQK